MTTQDEAYSGFVRGLFAKRNTGSEGLMHAAIGIAGEVGELMECLTLWLRGQGAGDPDERTAVRMHATEELGDYEFYAEAARDLLSVTREQCRVEERDAGISNSGWCMAVAASKVLDHAKKQWVYDRPLDSVAFMLALGQCDWYADQIRLRLGITREECIAANVEKLAKRYPQGYTDYHASARLDKAGG